MERSIDIATGESVAFNYELAGLGSRFFAVFVDMSLQIAIFLAAFLGLAFIGSKAGDAKPAPPLTKVESAVVVAIVIIALFLLFFGYFIIFEWLWEGRTPGKRLMGLRVIREGGVALDFTGSVIRNCVRIVEVLLGFYAISAVSTLLSPRNQRLGDYAAGTLVVRDQRYERRRIRAPPGRLSATIPWSATSRRKSATWCAASPSVRTSLKRGGARRTRRANRCRDPARKLGSLVRALRRRALLVHLAETSLA